MSDETRQRMPEDDINETTGQPDNAYLKVRIVADGLAGATQDESEAMARYDPPEQQQPATDASPPDAGDLTEADKARAGLPNDAIVMPPAPGEEQRPEPTTLQPDAAPEPRRSQPGQRRNG